MKWNVLKNRLLLCVYSSPLNPKRIVLKTQKDADKYLVHDIHQFPHTIVVVGKVRINASIGGHPSFLWCSIKRGGELILDNSHKWVFNERDPHIKTISFEGVTRALCSSAHLIKHRK
jgi:hypothetical protein